MGQALVPEAREVVHAMAELRRRVLTHTRELRGHLVLGFIAGDAAMPHTHAVLGGDVQAAFLRPPLPSGVRSLRIATEPRVACLSAADPLTALASDRPVTLMDLAEHLMVDVPAQSSRAWWDNWAVNPRPDGTAVRFGPVAADIEALLNTVARGTAMSFLPAAARHVYARSGIAYIDVADVPTTTSSLVWMPANRDSPAVAGLLEAAHAVLAHDQEGLFSPDPW